MPAFCCSLSTSALLNMKKALLSALIAPDGICFYMNNFVLHEVEGNVISVAFLHMRKNKHKTRN